eukprot:CAMPEP_0182433556 /NCGR_PEP_ID=MMETSP1167-20130531/63968_1 /TAXON_ID=2988 /ORGANISM="Mallomonas Sp, Strain CCMP3275" /LENGTH=450 /DNA_ID=CAMNT_0024622393 /DNA_START=170 /DNA_END=1522 /DNA_ORIENTATION=-
MAMLVERLIEDDIAGLSRIELSIPRGGNSTLTVVTVGKGIDTFLAYHPWWFIVKEPFKWDKYDLSHFDIVLLRYNKEMEIILRDILYSQYPQDCNSSLLRLQISGGFDSFGNMFFNYVTGKMESQWDVFSPYIIGNNVAFLDDTSCSHMHNRFQCAFIPVTNCSLPDELTSGKLLEPMFTSADRQGKAANDTYFRKRKESNPRYKIPKSKLKFKGERVYGLFTDSGLQRTHSHTDAYDLIFGYAYLYRPNHHFRSIIGHIIRDWKAKQLLPFPTNHDCIAVRIRRGDRALHPENVRDWCVKHVIHSNGSCYNDETQLIDSNPACEHWYDSGCYSLMPFAVITLEHVFNASRLISQSKNILIGCDDADWLKDQIQTTPTDFNVFTVTAPPNHRQSTYGGAQYMAAIELARECSALIGHTDSAVTTFFHNIMCIRHGGKQGECPLLYDFSGG